MGLKIPDKMTDVAITYCGYHFFNQEVAVVDQRLGALQPNQLEILGWRKPDIFSE